MRALHNTSRANLEGHARKKKLRRNFKEIANLALFTHYREAKSYEEFCVVVEGYAIVVSLFNEVRSNVEEQ